MVALDHLELMPNLSLLFSKVLVPVAVRAELRARSERIPRLDRLFETWVFIEHCDMYDPGAVDILLAEWNVKGEKDRGEAEAVMQAAQLGAGVVVDDPRGRKLARYHSLEYHGTAWVLERFFELGLFGAAELRAHFVELDRIGIRLPRRHVDGLMDSLGLKALNWR